MEPGYKKKFMNQALVGNARGFSVVKQVTHFELSSTVWDGRKTGSEHHFGRALQTPAG